jgi:hypothetical protein
MPPPRCGWSGRGRGAKADTVTEADRWAVRGSTLACQEVDRRAGGWPGGGASYTRST